MFYSCDIMCEQGLRGVRYLDSKLLTGSSMNASLASRVGAVTKNVLLDVIVVSDRGGTNRERRAKLLRMRGRLHSLPRQNHK